MAITLNGTTGIVTPDVNSTGGLTVDNDGATVATFDRATSDGTIVDLQKDGSSVGSIGTRNGHPSFGNTDTGIELNDFSEAVQPFNTSTNSTRDAAIDLGVSGARFKDLYLSGGIYLGGTGAANYLDDYEEGTFTPALHASGGTIPSITYGANNQGYYEKIGRTVIARFMLDVSSHSGGSGGATGVSGLPFSLVSGDLSATGFVAFYEQINLDAGFSQLALYYGGAGSLIYFIENGDNVNASNIAYGQLASALQIRGTAIYRAS